MSYAGQSVSSSQIKMVTYHHLPLIPPDQFLHGLLLEVIKVRSRRAATPWQVRSLVHVESKRDVKLLYGMAIWMINIWDNGDQWVWDAELRKSVQEWKHLSKVSKSWEHLSVYIVSSVLFQSLEELYRTFKCCVHVACCLVHRSLIMWLWSNLWWWVHHQCCSQLTNPKVTTWKSWQIKLPLEG